MQNVWGREEVRIKFRWGKLRERGHLEEPDVDERIILRWILRKWNGGMDWIDQTKKRDR